MSLTTWHPPPITHIGFPSHTSNSEYGRWSSMPNSHYSPVTVTTPTSSPWLHRKSFSSQSENPDSDIFSSSGTLAYNNNRQPDITFSDRNSSYPFASEVRKSLLTGNSSNNNKNDVKTILYTYNDPASLNSNNKISTSSYTPELYSSNENNAPSYKTNVTTAVKSQASPWNQNKYSLNSSSISGLESQKEPSAVSSPSWRSVKVSTSPTLSASTYVTEPTPTRGYELYSESATATAVDPQPLSPPLCTRHLLEPPGTSPCRGHTPSMGRHPHPLLIVLIPRLYLTAQCQAELSETSWTAGGMTDKMPMQLTVLYPTHHPESHYRMVTII